MRTKMKLVRSQLSPCTSVYVISTNRKRAFSRPSRSLGLRGLSVSSLMIHGAFGLRKCLSPIEMRDASRHAPCHKSIQQTQCSDSKGRSSGLKNDAVDQTEWAKTCSGEDSTIRQAGRIRLVDVGDQEDKRRRRSAWHKKSRDYNLLCNT
jgi:hypothetical protein